MYTHNEKSYTLDLKYTLEATVVLVSNKKTSVSMENRGFSFKKHPVLFSGKTRGAETGHELGVLTTQPETKGLRNH